VTSDKSCFSEGKSTSRDHWFRSAWDVDLVKRVRGRQSDAAYAEALGRAIAPADRLRWSTRSAADWANEAHEGPSGSHMPSWRRAVAAIDTEYEPDATAAVELQLNRASVPPATIINQAMER
jgi:hypothetical protein